MRIGILGATGMLGHHTARAVQSAGHELVVLHRSGARLERLGELRFDSRIADLDDEASLLSAFDGLDGVVNAAAYYPTVPRPWRDEVAKALAQMDAFYTACRIARVPRVLYVGGSIALKRSLDDTPGDADATQEERPPGHNAYVQVKWELDRQAREAAARGLPVVIGIPTMTFGEFDYGPTTGRFVVEIANGTMAHYVAGRRNAVYAGDAGRGLLLALERGRVGERYVLTGVNVTMDDLVQRIARLAGVQAPTPVPLGLARFVAAVQALRYRIRGGAPPQLNPTALAIMAAGQFLDGAKAQRELGYAPTVDLDEALRRSLVWFRQVGYVR